MERLDRVRKLLLDPPVVQRYWLLVAGGQRVHVLPNTDLGALAARRRTLGAARLVRSRGGACGTVARREGLVKELRGGPFVRTHDRWSVSRSFGAGLG